MYLPVPEDLLTVHVNGGKDGWRHRRGGRRGVVLKLLAIQARLLSVMCLPILEDLLTAHVDGGMDGVSRRTWIHGPVRPGRPEADQIWPLVRTAEATHSPSGPPYPWSRSLVNDWPCPNHIAKRGGLDPDRP